MVFYQLEMYILVGVLEWNINGLKFCKLIIDENVKKHHLRYLLERPVYIAITVDIFFKTILSLKYKLFQTRKQIDWCYSLKSSKKFIGKAERIYFKIISGLCFIPVLK